MRVARPPLRLLAAVAVVGLVGAGGVACSRTIDGRGAIAEGVVTPGPTGTATPTDTPNGSPTTTRAASPSSTPTVDPVKTKERVTCVLVQATIKSTNDTFNAAKTRDAQLKVLTSAYGTIDKTLRASGLPSTDKIYVQARAISTELKKIVTLAKRGGRPSTGPYNTLTTRFRTACLDL
jgi:hypothetical protein